MGGLKETGAKTVYFRQRGNSSTGHYEETDVFFSCQHVKLF